MQQQPKTDPPREVVYPNGTRVLWYSESLPCRVWVVSTYESPLGVERSYNLPLPPRHTGYAGTEGQRDIVIQQARREALREQQRRPTVVEVHPAMWVPPSFRDPTMTFRGKDKHPELKSGAVVRWPGEPQDLGTVTYERGRFTILWHQTEPNQLILDTSEVSRRGRLTSSEGSVRQYVEVVWCGDRDARYRQAARACRALAAGVTAVKAGDQDKDGSLGRRARRSLRELIEDTQELLQGTLRVS